MGYQESVTARNGDCEAASQLRSDGRTVAIEETWQS